MQTAKTLEEYIGHLAGLPEGTLLPVHGIAGQLELFISSNYSATREESVQVDINLTARERFWMGPAEVRLSAHELAEALGKPVSWIHKRTSPKSKLPILPHAKIGQALVFTVGKVREWLDNHTTVKHGRP